MMPASHMGITLSPGCSLLINVPGTATEDCSMALTLVTCIGDLTMLLAIHGGEMEDLL